MNPEILQKIKDKAKNPDPPFWGNGYEHDAFEKGFTAGASFATTDPLILQSLLKPFGDWLWRNYKQIDAQVWKERYVPSEKCYTIYQVIGNYIQHLQTTQPKEDARQ